MRSTLGGTGFVFKTLNWIQGWYGIPSALRVRMLRAAGIKIGPNTGIWPSVVFHGSNLEIGRDAFINAGCVLDAVGRIDIGDSVRMGFNAKLITSTHDIGHGGDRAGSLKYLPITIGDGCWIGAAAIVLPGVSVAPGCIVAAGAVVTRDRAANGLYAGVPARRIRDLDA